MRNGNVFNSLCAFLAPVCAGLFGYLILAEGLGINELAGGVVILAGVLFSELGPARFRSGGNPYPHKHREHPDDHHQ